jgi:hypothetical protein
MIPENPDRLMPAPARADSPRSLELAGITLALTWVAVAVGAEPLRVTADFEGGSAKILQIDQVSRTVDVMPAGTPDRGWPCWWYLRVDGLAPGERLTLRLHASAATKAAGGKALAAARSMPDQPRWAETAAAQRRIAGLVARGRMDVFLVLHNPSAGDPRQPAHGEPVSGNDLEQPGEHDGRLSRSGGGARRGDAGVSRDEARAGRSQVGRLEFRPPLGLGIQGVDGGQPPAGRGHAAPKSAFRGRGRVR